MQALVAFAARYLFALVVAAEVIFILLRHRSQWKRLLIATVVIGGLSLAIGMALNAVVQDPRPFVVDGSTPLVPGSRDNGFPSDHTLLLAATAAIIMTVSPWAGTVGLVLAVLVGMARVQAGLHHTADIVGSLLIVGFVTAGYLVVWALVEARKRSKVSPPGK